MEDQANRGEPARGILAELSALADGRLDPRRAAAVRELIERSPELSERYQREGRAVEALRALQAERAPDRLRARIETERGRPQTRPRPGRVAFAGSTATGRGRLVYGGAAAGVLAAAGLALALVLPSGTPGSPSVSQAASLALKGSSLPAPLPRGTSSTPMLAREVEEVYFPNWSRSFGWQATGQRIDRLNGRLAITVYYARATQQIAYTIVAAPALRWPGSTPFRIHGIEFQAFNMGQRLAVTWRRAGHTCVLSGTGVSVAELSRLAAWKVLGAQA